jgi:RHS repeat-associated protein
MDSADNLLRQPGLHQVSLREGNRLRSVNGLEVTYNDRNHIGGRDSIDGAVTYAYDSRDQLIQVETPRGIWTADYDALGRRTRKTWRGSVTEYYWNTDQLIAEVSGDGGVRVYVYADPLALTPILFVDYDSIESPPESGRRYIVFTDQIGTPRLVEDEAGAEVWRALIEPYGRVEIAPNATIAFNLRFPGHYHDPETGLHYNRFRYYDPALGRYLQSDPWGITGGYNLYAYRPNPLQKVDVRGLGEENDPACQPKHDEESTTPPSPPGPAPANQEAPAARQPLSREEGQRIVDAMHGALADETQQANRTTGLTQLEDGRIVLTSSHENGVTPAQREVARQELAPHGYGDGDILCPNERGNPAYVPRDERNLQQTPDPGSANHAEQKGIQVGEQQGSPAVRQWSSSGAEHGGAACPGCEQAQQGHGVRNETGTQADGGRYDEGGDEPDWNPPL